MRRKIFSEKNYDLKKLLLPYESFRLFCDREDGLCFCEEYREEAIKRAEGLLNKRYEVMPATAYLMFVRNGNRDIYEGLYLERRTDLIYLTVAEIYEGKGRFTDAALDLVWMILEESSWVIPAHINPIPGDKTHPLPYSYENERNYLDIYGSGTGAVVAFAYRIFEKGFDIISPVINKRIIENLHNRVIMPLLSHPDEQLWMGKEGGWLNNWCPWVLSNILTVAALTVREGDIRQRVAEMSLEGLDLFTYTYEDDGACEEGPNYWGAACGALYNACLVLYDMSGGEINIFTDPLMIKMGEFMPKTYIANGSFLNFSDSRPKLKLEAWGLDWSRFSGSELMRDFWNTVCKNDGSIPKGDYFMPYRFFRLLGSKSEEGKGFKVEKKVYIESLQISVVRESEICEEGFCLSLKGSHNQVSHNHLDVGNFVLFRNGLPIFIDAGVGTYTAKTFNEGRYSIWSMRSEYHNLPTINGTDQKPGRRFAASDPIYDPDSGELDLSLKSAYPESSGIEVYRRRAGIKDRRAYVYDTIESQADGNVIFHLICNSKPELTCDGCFTVNGCKVFFDSSLAFDVDIPDTNNEETAIIPSSWDCEAIYRINLSAPLEAGKKYCFKIEVEG